MTGKLMMHTSITSDLMGRFQHYGILDISELEQTIATGSDGDGKTVSEAKMVQRCAAGTLPMGMRDE
jgi:hypothetical protein